MEKYNQLRNSILLSIFGLCWTKCVMEIRYPTLFQNSSYNLKNRIELSTKIYFIMKSMSFINKYVYLPNNSMGWNKHIGWKNNSMGWNKHIGWKNQYISIKSYYKFIRKTPWGIPIAFINPVIQTEQETMVAMLREKN